MRIRFHLQQATRAAHDRLDAAIEQSGAFTSAERYRRFLLASAAGHAAVEAAQALGATDPPLPLPVPLRSATALRDAGAAQIPNGLSAPAPFGAAGLPALVGQLYVVEGSALGGQILVRRLRKIGLVPEIHGRFLSGADIGGTARWARFLAWLEAWEPTEAERELAGSAAIETFDWFHEVYARALDPA